MWVKVILILFLGIPAIIDSLIMKELKVDSALRPFKESRASTNVTEKIETITGKVKKWKTFPKEEQSNVSAESVEFVTEQETTATTNTLLPSPITWIPEYTNKKIEKTESKASEDVKIDVCERFKKPSVKFDLNKMRDVWQTLYYQLPEKVECFKMLIKKISEEDKRRYANKYGNFNGAVDWDECNLEIVTANQNGRRHFLQGINEDYGVMDNIIIVEDNETHVPTLQEESADQWLVSHNILLMRDCDIGGVVIFSRVPTTPTPHEIEYALQDFKEETINGKIACDAMEEVFNKSFEEDEID